MTSNDALILDLATGLAPVRRRNPWREALWVLALAGAELALLLAFGAMRPDMGRVILSPFMIWKMGSLAMLTGISLVVAMRSFSPPVSARHGMTVALGLAGLAMIGGMGMAPPVEGGGSLLDRLAPAHGLLCVTAIIVLALPLMLALAWLMQRAAPVHPRRSAFASGFAASTCAGLVFTACCPMNDPLYIIVWYSVGVAAVTLLARWLLPGRLRL
ncbi:NrsF family protein [Sphingomonas sp.]|uniref:NrsF family protein n=1 Tax=Sphingomonas sp. TaxID=28214 RepID=UPI000DB517BF|nr:NrsF family protein [Sphingomonas sp.]PZU10103.1 MAG: DUF1109 domain-containing protein [Sphingomonas sp.]